MRNPHDLVDYSLTALPAVAGMGYADQAYAKAQGYDTDTQKQAFMMGTGKGLMAYITGLLERGRLKRESNDAFRDADLESYQRVDSSGYYDPYDPSRIAKYGGVVGMSDTSNKILGMLGDKKKMAKGGAVINALSPIYNKGQVLKSSTGNDYSSLVGRKTVDQPLQAWDNRAYGGMPSKKTSSQSRPDREAMMQKLRESFPKPPAGTKQAYGTEVSKKEATAYLRKLDKYFNQIGDASVIEDMFPKLYDWYKDNLHLIKK